MIEITGYQWENISYLLGTFGFMLIMGGYCAWFIHKGLKRK